MTHSSLIFCMRRLPQSYARLVLNQRFFNSVCTTCFFVCVGCLYTSVNFLWQNIHGLSLYNFCLRKSVPEPPHYTFLKITKWYFNVATQSVKSLLTYHSIKHLNILFCINHLEEYIPLMHSLFLMQAHDTWLKKWKYKFFRNWKTAFSLKNCVNPLNKLYSTIQLFQHKTNL